MGRLGDVVGKVEKKVDLVFLVSGKTLIWHRPMYDEEKLISDRLGEVKTAIDTQDYVVRASAFVLKMLCDAPDLHDEPEEAIVIDLKQMEAADRNSILPFYTTLVNANPEVLSEALAKQLLSERTRTKS